MHPFQILFVRQSITATCCTTYGLATGKIPDFPLGPRSVRGLLVFRAICGFFGVFGLYFSLLYLPLSEATVLTFLAPILTCYTCSWLMPGETFTRQQQLAGFVSLIGVVFIAQPASLFRSAPSSDHPDSSSMQPTAHQRLLAIAISMLGVLGTTGALTAIRTIGTRAHPFLSVNYFSVWCSLVSLVCLIILPDIKFRLPGNTLEWGILAMLGFSGFVMQFLLTAGLAYGGADGKEKNASANASESESESDNAGIDLEGAAPHRRSRGKAPMSQAMPKSADLKAGSQTRATSMVYTQMLFALAGDKLVFGVTPGTMSWIGSALVLSGAVWVAAARDQGKKDTSAGSSTSTDAMELDGVEATLPVHRPKTRMRGTREEEAGLMAGLAGEEGVELDELAQVKEDESGGD
jgi:drug/metabolite transporter (DMT)-like permease